MLRNQITPGGHYSYGLASAFGTRVHVVVVDKGPFAKAPTPDHPPIPVDRSVVKGWIRSRRGSYLAVRRAGNGHHPLTPIMIVKCAEIVRPWDQEVEEQRKFDAARAAATEARHIDGARVAALKARLAALNVTGKFSQGVGGTVVTLTYDALEHLVTRAERV